MRRPWNACNRRLVVAGMLLVVTGICVSAGGEPTPVFRQLPAPKVLYIANSPNQEEWAELLRHNGPADVAFAPLEYGDLEHHHLCDKPLEERPEETKLIAQKARQHVDQLVARLDQFDVVIAQFQPSKEPEIQRRLVAWVRRGGRLMFVNPSWETTFEGTPLAEVMPVKAGQHKAWTSECPGATDHPLTRGLPLEILGTHWYGPVYEPADETCVPLTLGNKAPQGWSQNAQFWYRKLSGGGQVVHLFAAAGSKWQWTSGTHYAAYAADRPDDSAAWNALYQRLLYGLVYGDKAFPIPAKIVLPEKDRNCRSGEKLAIAVDLENRAGEDREVKVVLEISHRRSTARVTAVREVSLAKNQRTAVAFSAVVDLPCSDSFLLVRARVLDREGRMLLSESTAWIPYVHAVPLTVETNQASYAPAQPIQATVGGTLLPDQDARNHTITLYLVDHAGRALQQAEGRPSGGSANGKPAAWQSQFVMPDGGPECVGCYWITAVARRGGQIVGLARSQVQLDRPWDMRSQFQWSLWSQGAEPRKMALYHDAGFNSLGMSGHSAQADRYAMRQYVEGTGIDTFSVTIDHDNWNAVRAAMVKTVEGLRKGGPDARSKALVSLGEESGFQGGWGTRYYWKEDKAPPLVQKVFGDYLAELYGGKIAELNRQWGTRHASFAEIPLEKAKVAAASSVFVTSQAWEAMQRKGETKGQPAVPVNVAAPDPKQEFLAHSAPYHQTHRFFDWYYQKYCDLATEVYRANRNPVPRTIMSAPGGFYPKVDVYNFAGVGPFYPKETALVENAIARRDYGDVPGFSAAMWAYYDLRSLWEAVVYSSILAGNTHMDYWVDVPLTFNADLTHTRASFWTKVLRSQLRPIEPILLHKRIAYTKGLGLYAPGQPLAKGLLGDHFGSAVSCNAPLYSALEESGYLPKVVGAGDLKGIDLLIASYAQVIGPDDGRRLADFVRGGGTLVATPWLGCCSPHGNMLSVYPAAESGLAELLGFRLLNASQKVEAEEVTVDLHGQVGVSGALRLLSKGRDKPLGLAADVQVLAQYKDGTPLLLSRSIGRGKVVYLNLVYDWNHWWNSFHEPPREAYRKLIAGIVETLGRLKPDYFIAFQAAEPADDNKGWWGMVMPSKPELGEAVPWWASQLYADASGKVKYLAVFSDHRSPAITAQVRWPDPKARIFDLLTGQSISANAGTAPLMLRPGQAALWAITREAPQTLRLALAKEVRAGEPLKLAVELPELTTSDVSCGLLVEVFDPAGRLSAAHSLHNLVATGGRAEAAVPTALNDPPGEYHVVVTESMTRIQAKACVSLRGAEDACDPAVLDPFPKRSGEDWQPSQMGSEDFLRLLRGLREVYLGGYQGLEAKYALSYYLNVPFRPNGRHAIVRRLQRTDWQPHLEAVAKALRAGETFYLLGEDLNVDPTTATTIDPLATADVRAFLDALAKSPGASRRSTRAGTLEFDVLRVGNGALVTGKASVDRTAYLSSDYVKWHESLKAALRLLKW